MNSKKGIKIAIYIFFVALGAGLFFFVIRNKSFGNIIDIISGADPFWITMVALVSFSCHVIRALRWHLLLEANRSKPSKVYTYHCMMFGYLVNMVAPRVGELTRCAALRKRNKISFNVTFGTVIMDKLLDVIVLILIIGSVLAVYFNDIWLIISKDIPAQFPNNHSSNLKFWLLGAVIVLFLLWILLRRRLDKTGMRINNFIRQVYRGIVSIKDVKRKWMLILYTILIWFCYFLMSYLCFFSLDETKSFSPNIALIILALGGIARAVPIPAGSMGAYHIIISAALVRFTVLPNDINGWEIAFGLATIIHGMQMLFYLCFGGISSLVVWKQKVLR